MVTKCVGVILYDRDDFNRVLLVRHTERAKLPTSSYGFPAGRVESGEELVVAAVREFFEETGLRTKRWYLHPLPSKRSTLQMREGVEEFDFNLFVCTRYTGKLRASDKTIPEWVGLDSLDRLLLVSRDVLELSREIRGVYRSFF